MSASYTPEQVEALAPDAGSLKSGRQLASASKWTSLGRSEVAVWGLCQGSGKDPYQAQVELAEPALRCSCPSHKFPCKHGLGLLLLFAGQPQAFPAAEPPAWVADWLASRAKRAEQKVEKAARAADAVTDSAAQAKRAVQREARVAAGLDFLETWLCDIARGGLAGLPSRPYQFWDGMAARLVDAQAGGLAGRVRALASIPASGDGWQARLLEQLGLLYLLIEGFRRLDALPAATQADIRAAIGWNVNQEELLAAGEGVRDRWFVAGQRVEQEERLRVQRTWLLGRESGRPALLLAFAAAGQPLENTLVTGATYDAELVFYPSGAPLRALVRQRSGGAADPEPFGALAIDAAIAAFADAVAANPWLEALPAALAAVTPVRQEGGWRLEDEAGAALPLVEANAAGWRLAAVSGGRPVALCGEWNGRALLPLGVWTESGYAPL